MKKVLFLLAMLPMFVFSACSDDDEKLQDQSVVIKTGEIYTLEYWRLPIRSHYFVLRDKVCWTVSSVYGNRFFIAYNDLNANSHE